MWITLDCAVILFSSLYPRLASDRQRLRSSLSSDCRELSRIGCWPRFCRISFISSTLEASPGAQCAESIHQDADKERGIQSLCVVNLEAIMKQPTSLLLSVRSMPGEAKPRLSGSHPMWVSCSVLLRVFRKESFQGCLVASKCSSCGGLHAACF